MMASRVSSLVTPHLTKWLVVPLKVPLPDGRPVDLVNDFFTKNPYQEDAEVDDGATSFDTFGVQW
jgi:hypothetical protein